jgi:hypothetical protein
MHTLFANPDLGKGDTLESIRRNDDYYFAFFCLAHLARADDGYGMNNQGGSTFYPQALL